MSSRKRRQKKSKPVQSPKAIKKKKKMTPRKPEQKFITEEDLLADYTEPVMANHKDKDEDKDEKETKSSSKGGEKRSFQVGGDPAIKTLLTKEEAEKHGLYWKEDDPAKTKGKD